MPGQNVSQLSQPGVQAMGDTRPPPSRFGKCGNNNHKTAACRYPERVCFWCKKPGHQVNTYLTKPTNWGNRRAPQKLLPPLPRCKPWALTLDTRNLTLLGWVFRRAVYKREIPDCPYTFSLWITATRISQPKFIFWLIKETPWTTARL